MLKLLRKQKQDQHGFTLLELLMVVIIIAILVSIALPQYFRATERARTGQVLSLLASIRGAEMRYKATSPSNIYTLVATDLDLTLPTAAQMPAGWDTLTVATVAGAGANTTVNRSAGVNSGADLMIDLDAGTICASTAAAAADWGVSAAAC